MYDGRVGEQRLKLRKFAINGEVLAILRQGKRREHLEPCIDSLHQHFCGQLIGATSKRRDNRPR